ncbi:MAG: hypothetical protein M1833_001074 [Piccolia ochrophora]|nr:MAG: hypothetical protein M1833_001074 [Piccolia ochrophora]
MDGPLSLVPEDHSRPNGMEETTVSPVPINAPTTEGYKFPGDRLKKVMSDSSKTPLCLVSCGSFSPITFLHLRMFEMAADYVRFNTDYEIVGGFLSPVSDAYKKAGLASADHRSSWLTVDPWEAEQKVRLFRPEVIPILIRPRLIFLDLPTNGLGSRLNQVQGGVETYLGEKKPVQIALLAGADLIQTMSTPGLWSAEDLDHILGRYGSFIIERTGTDVDDALASLQKWRSNIHVVQQLIQNDVSSTKIRLFLRREMSVRYLIPAPVIQYIEDNGLYEEDGGASASSLLDKGKTSGSREE